MILDRRRPGLGRRGALLMVGLALNSCGLGDLVSTPASAPAAPASLAQTKSDGTTAVALGSATNEPVVTFVALLTDPDAQDQVRLEVEVQTLGVAFTDSATATATAVASGAVAAVAVSGLLENTPYHWQARAVDQGDRASAWVPFGGNPEDQADFSVDATSEPPASPTEVAQLKSDGTTVIAPGAATDDTTVVFRAMLSDPDAGDSLRFEVERQLVGTPFANQPNGASTPVPSGAAARVTLGGHLDNASYHWQARAIDRTGLTTAWVPFGGPPESQADYLINIPEPPNLPYSLGQFRQNGQQEIAVGGSTDQTTVVLKATVTDPDLGDQVRLEVEVRPVGVGFTNTVTSASTLGPSGEASVSVSPLAPGTSYHWQARVADQSGRLSPWVSFGANLETETDFTVQ